jgi:hypothetical protein
MQTQKQLEQLARQAQERSAWEADQLHKRTRSLIPRVTINTATTPLPSSKEKMWTCIGDSVLTHQTPFSPLQQLVNILHVLSQTHELVPSEKWDPVFTKLQLRSAELLFENGLFMMAIATSKEVLKRHPDNTRALRVVEDVRAQPM